MMLVVVVKMMRMGVLVFMMLMMRLLEVLLAEVLLGQVKFLSVWC